MRIPLPSPLTEIAVAVVIAVIAVPGVPAIRADNEHNDKDNNGENGGFPVPGVPAVRVDGDDGGRGIYNNNNMKNSIHQSRYFVALVVPVAVMIAK